MLQQMHINEVLNLAQKWLKPDSCRQHCRRFRFLDYQGMSFSNIKRT